MSVLASCLISDRWIASPTTAVVSGNARILGAIVLAHQTAPVPVQDLLAGLCPEAGAALLWLPTCSGTSAATIFALADRLDIWTQVRGEGIMMLVPPTLTSRLHRSTVTDGVLSSTPATIAVAHLARGLLARDLVLSRVQAGLAGRALTELLIAALAPSVVAGRAVAAQRKASLLQRLCDHIDHHLADDLDVSSLCAVLACSRSALYRATGPVGGVAALVLHRRLAMAHRRLVNPDDRTAITAVANQSGFVDAAGFSRAFKRQFGINAGGVRRRSVSGVTPPRP